MISSIFLSFHLLHLPFPIFVPERSLDFLRKQPSFSPPSLRKILVSQSTGEFKKKREGRRLSDDWTDPNYQQTET